MISMLRIAGLAVALSCGCAAANAASLAIVNARLETITHGTIDSGTLLMSDGRIVALGTTVQVPAGASMTLQPSLVMEN